MWSVVVNDDTNGIIKILLIRNYDAVFEVCLNFVSNWLLIAIESDGIAGGEVSCCGDCCWSFFRWARMICFVIEKLMEIQRKEILQLIKDNWVMAKDIQFPNFVTQKKTKVISLKVAMLRTSIETNFDKIFWQK